MKNQYRILTTVAFVCVLLCSFHTIQAQTSAQEASYTVTGVVADENMILPGVSIILQGTNVGTESDIDGNFEFPQALNVGDVLIFSHIGMKTQKVAIKSPSSGSIVELNVSLISDSYNLLGTVSSKKVYSSKKR